MFAILVSGVVCFYSVFVYIRMPFSWAKGGKGNTTAKLEVQSKKWNRTWTKWLPIPTGVGITILAILQWRNIRNQQIHEQQKRTINDWEITCYRCVPLRPLSRAWGWISDRPVPVSLRYWVYNNFARLYKVNLDEVERELNSYPSLADFFSRRLKEGVRPIDFSQCIVSPADGRVLNLGEVSSCHIEQVKGVTYTLQTFLGDLNWKVPPYSKINLNNFNVVTTKNNRLNRVSNSLVIDSASDVEDSIFNYVKESIRNDDLGANVLNKVEIFENNQSRFTNIPWTEYKRQLLKNPAENELYQIVVYLAPGDYHRFHSPVHWKVSYRRHFQGELLSVNPRIAGWVPELFSLNERVIYFGEWEHGFFSMAAVGATNVGSIKVHKDKTLHTNCRKWPNGVRHKDVKFDAIEWQKGEEVGEFRMGSTVVILFEAPKDYKFSVSPNDKVKVGQSVTCPVGYNDTNTETETSPN